MKSEVSNLAKVRVDFTSECAVRLITIGLITNYFLHLKSGYVIKSRGTPVTFSFRKSKIFSLILNYAVCYPASISSSNNKLHILTSSSTISIDPIIKDLRQCLH